MAKFTCPDCGEAVKEEGLCEFCKEAYAKACDNEGAGDASTSEEKGE